MERLIFVIKGDGIPKMDEILEKIDPVAEPIESRPFESVPRPLVEEFYQEHQGKGFYDRLLDQYAGSRWIAYVLQDKRHGTGFVQRVSDVVGATNPADAAEGTIRRMAFSQLTDPEVLKFENMVHRSDSLGSAARECLILFDDGIYGINRRPTDLDLWIEEQKGKEKEAGTYVQHMDTKNARRIADGIKGRRVLLVGGLREKGIIGEASGNLVNVDYTCTGEADMIGDIEGKLPLDAKSFEDVVMMNLFEILYNPARACSEAYRLLKRGGKLWVTESDSPGSHKSQGYGLLIGLSGKIDYLADQLRLRGLAHYPDGRDAYSVTPDFIRNAMELGGFFPQKISYHGDLVVAVK